MAAIKHYLVINSSSEKVFRAVTTSEGISGWWTKNNMMSSKVGDEIEFIFGNRYHNKMEITNLVENKFVKWKCIEGDTEWIGTIFTFHIEKENGNSILRFAHDDWREETDFFASCNFQWGHYMQSLKDYCETGKGTPFEERN